MGQYQNGDVLLAPVRCGRFSDAKIRPVVVIESRADGFLRVCPVTGSMPDDMSASVTLDLDDFAKGGLDMFDESYILVSNPVTICKRDVIGKKGRLTGGCMDEIISGLSGSLQ